MDNSGYEDRSGLIAGVEFQGTLGMLFGFFKVAFFVGARGFIQLVLGSNFIYE